MFAGKLPANTVRARAAGISVLDQRALKERGDGGRRTNPEPSAASASRQLI